MDINRANMDVFFEDLDVRFTEGFNTPGGTPILTSAGMVVPSTSAQGVHAWLNQIPNMREWLGDRQAKNIRSNKLTVVNRLFEDTLEIERVDIEDDSYGMYAPLSGLMGSNAAAFKDEVVVEALLNGTTDKWVDDVAIFSAAGRSYDGTNAINNYGTTALDAAGVQLAAAYAAMGAYLGHNGKPLRAVPTYLMHGPALRSVAMQNVENIYAALLAADGSTYVPSDNVNKGLVKRLECPFLIDGYVDSKGNSHDAANYWFLLAFIGGIRPVAYQDRIGPELQRARLDPNTSDYVFEKDKFQYGVRMRGAGFVTLPHLVFGGFAT